MISITQPRIVRLRGFVRVWVDTLTYAVTLTVMSAALAVTLGVTTGGGVVRGKHLLFVFGWTMMAYATATLWVRSGKQLRAAHAGQQEPGPQQDGSDNDTQQDSMAATSSLRNRVTSEGTQHNGYGESLRERQDETRFQALVQTLPPNRWIASPRPERRMGIAGKLLVTSVFVLALSFVMETVFGVV